jgi:hypothetical protein
MVHGPDGQTGNDSRHAGQTYGGVMDYSADTPPAASTMSPTEDLIRERLDHERARLER